MPGPDAKALQAEIERLKAETAEKDVAVRYWHEAATKGKQQPAQDTKVDPPAEEEDPIAVLSAKGAKGFDEMLEKRGFVRAADVEKTVNAKAAVIAAENALASRYPELKDTKSDFFKATAEHYARLTKAEGVPHLAAMKLAAKEAELDSLNSGKRQTQAQIDKEEREARAKAQAGDKRRGKDADAEPDNDTLDAEQKRVCEQMGITEEAYVKRAKAGVVYGRRV